jgi:hypothetical protein
VDEFVNIRSKLADAQNRVSSLISGAHVTLISVDREHKVSYFEGTGASFIRAQPGSSSVLGLDFRSICMDKGILGAVDQVIQGTEVSFEHQQAIG